MQTEANTPAKHKNYYCTLFIIIPQIHMKHNIIEKDRNKRI